DPRDERRALGGRWPPPLRCASRSHAAYDRQRTGELAVSRSSGAGARHSQPSYAPRTRRLPDEDRECPCTRRLLPRRGGGVDRSRACAARAHGAKPIRRPTKAVIRESYFAVAQFAIAGAAHGIAVRHLCEERGLLGLAGAAKALPRHSGSG